MKYIISTLGCKVNQYETQAMETLLMAHGHESAAPGEIADAVIINTCAVTAESGRKSRQTIRRLRDENPGAVVGVCGCYSQLDPAAAQSIGADVVFGSADRTGFVAALEEAWKSRTPTVQVDRPFDRRVMEVLPAGAMGGRTRAMLKIQDGCVNFCSYCIIPYTRGRICSLPIDQAVKETERLRDEGYRELVLTGIEVAAYGSDLPGKPTLADVIVACAEVSGSMRIRLGSLEPTLVTREFAQRTAATGKLCRHFHLSMQSGCDRTLKAMNRKYDTARYYETVCILREAFPGCAITTDMITGFPGETEADQQESLEFIQKCEFSGMHIFPYSRRPGTVADKLPQQHTSAVKSARAREAQKVADQMEEKFLQQSVGQVLPVLFETEEDGYSIGHSDTYLRVKVPGTELRGKLKNIKISCLEAGVLVGEIID